MDDAIRFLKAGHDYKGIKSMLENYCVHCLESVPDNKGAWTNHGNECDSCLAKC